MSSFTISGSSFLLYLFPVLSGNPSLKRANLFALVLNELSREFFFLRTSGEAWLGLFFGFDFTLFHFKAVRSSSLSLMLTAKGVNSYSVLFSNHKLIVLFYDCNTRNT